MTQKAVRLALLASGSGSNAENISRYFAGNPFVEIALIVSNKEDAYVHQRAEKLGIKSLTIPKSDLCNGHFMVGFMKDNKIDFIVLAGYLLMVPEELVRQFPERILNIHPALLPKYGGKGMYGDRVHEAVVQAREKESGITIHFVNEHYDEGAIVFQATCPVLPGDGSHEVAEKVHALEYKHFPGVIAQTLEKKFGLIL